MTDEQRAARDHALTRIAQTYLPDLHETPPRTGDAIPVRIQAALTDAFNAGRQFQEAQETAAIQTAINKADPAAAGQRAAARDNARYRGRPDVSTTNYRFNHGRAPRGYGRWAFGPSKTTHPDHIFWYTGTYAEAKAAAIAYFTGKTDWIHAQT